MSAELAGSFIGAGEQRLTLPTAPSPVTTHCRVVSDKAGAQTRSRCGGFAPSEIGWLGQPWRCGRCWGSRVLAEREMGSGNDGDGRGELEAVEQAVRRGSGWECVVVLPACDGRRWSYVLRQRRRGVLARAPKACESGCSAGHKRRGAGRQKMPSVLLDSRDTGRRTRRPARVWGSPGGVECCEECCGGCSDGEVKAVRSGNGGARWPFLAVAGAYGNNPFCRKNV